MTEPLVLDQVSSPESPPSHAIRSSEGRGGQRSRTGCWTCRNKKVKCDEHRPICKRCSRLKRECDYAPRTKPRRRRKEESPPTAALVRRNAGASTVSTGSQSAGRLLDGPGSIARNLLSSISTAACSVTLTDDEHEAIRYFRSSFAQMSHTKNPKYSLYSIMFRIAQDEPMVMHMVTALGGREIEFIREKEEPVGSRKAVYHYSSALRMMADAVERENHVSRLDVILTALYLMLVYEQKFGDPSCSALSSHLLGTASILQHRCPGLFLLPSPIKSTPHTSRALTYAAKNPDSNSTVSQYSARLLLWISLIDASAASCGIGGQFNAALFKALSETSPNGGGSQFQPIERFSRMHRYSNPLYRTVWGDSYPQSELLDDVENRNIYALRGECGQLWFMIAQLAALYKTDPEAAEQRATIVEQAIEHVGEKFTELMEVASELSIDTDNSHRLVANIRSIVPYYYASVLDFYRVTKFDEPLDYRQRHALKETMNLAFQSFQYEGDQAMTRIAWPLFVAALETDDLLHRDWVMNRFAGMQKYGRNYERAHKFLVQTVAAQDRLGHRLDMREQLKSGAFDMFVM